MKRVSIKQLAKILMEDSHVLATHHGGEEGTDGIEKDVLSRSWGDDEEANPELDFVDEARFAEIAGLPLQEQASGVSPAIGRQLNDLSYKFEDEINARMGSEDRNWYKNEDVILAVLEMLDGLKETIQEYGKMK